jgi:hypothetical protein
LLSWLGGAIVAPKAITDADGGRSANIINRPPRALLVALAGIMGADNQGALLTP